MMRCVREAWPFRVCVFSYVGGIICGALIGWVFA